MHNLLIICFFIYSTESGNRDATAVADGDDEQFTQTFIHSMNEEYVQRCYDPIPTEVLIKIETKAPANSINSPYFFVHSMEGVVTYMKPLAAKLNAPVYGLECTKDTPLSSINDLAAFYVKKIKTVQSAGPYIIVGYSFGATVGFGMALLLEKSGEKVTLVMIDGAPEYARWYIESHQKRTGLVTGTQNESNILAYVGLITANCHFTQTINELNTLKTFDHKLTRITEIIRKNVKLSSETVKTIAMNYYTKLRAAQLYRPEHKLNHANVILVKPIDNYVKLADDYGLSDVRILF